MHRNVEKMLEALLFENGEGYTLDKLSRITGYDRDVVEEGLSDLAHSLKAADRGIRLLRKDDRALLVATNEAADIISSLRSKELAGPLSSAALETLTIILYLGPVEKKNIDYIRGVNSRGMLRILRARDLVEHERKEGVVHYTGTVKLLQFLGIERPEQLPNYDKAREQFKNALAGEAEK